MRVLAAGLNAHHQISSANDSESKFTLINDDADDVLLVTWSTIVILANEHVTTRGYQRLAAAGKINGAHSAIGDHDGLLAVLDRDGELYVVEESPVLSEQPLLKHCDSKATPTLSHIAMADNGRVACIFQQAQHDNLFHIGEFPSFDAFKAWYQDPSELAVYPAGHYMVAGRPKQLSAGTGMFALLTDSGEVYTWGDPRQQSLARSIAGDEGIIGASEPGLVDALAGVRLKRICLGGWMGGAISEDGAAYIWGTGNPGKPAMTTSFDETSKAERVKLLQLGNDESEEPDIIDVDIGSGHIALITSTGEVYVAGENVNGQLGLSSAAEHIDKLTIVPGVHNAVSVVCASRSTVILQSP